MLYITNKDFKIESPSIITLGNFDGVHIGHRQLIDTLLKYETKENTKKIVFSFYPHPLAIIKGTTFPTLFNKYERKNIMASLDVDVFVEYPFDSVTKDILPRDFVVNILYKQLNCKAIIVGEGYKFGKMHMGDVDLLREIGKELNIEIITIPHSMYKGEKISSSIIRTLLSERKMEEVNYLLGKPYFILGNVTQGKRLGRTIGFPTINVVPSRTKLLPPKGVYMSRVFIGGIQRKSITNIGTNPTVNGTITLSESHIIDFGENLYGHEVKVELLKWIRDEKKFASIEELKNQISIDVEISKNGFL